MNFKIQVLNGFKLYFDQISNVFKSRYESDDKINLDALNETTGLNRRKTRILLNFLSDIGFAKKIVLDKTELGNVIYVNDPYMEDEGTLWLMHYLSGVNEHLIIWNRFFNELYSKDSFYLSDVVKLYDDLKELVSEYTFKYHIRKEITVLLDAYTNQRLSRLDILEKYEDEKEKYKIVRNQNVPDLIFLACCIKFRDKYFKGATAVEIEDICYSENSPGRIFLLSEDVIRNKLEKLKNDRYITLESRGDLDQIRITNNIVFENIVSEYYKRPNNNT